MKGWFGYLLKDGRMEGRKGYDGYEPLDEKL